MNKSYSNTQLNTSKSKQKYSFSKAQRFPTSNHPTPLCYNIDLSQNGPKAIFGSSAREQPFKCKIYSPSAKYNIRSSFDLSLNQKSGSTIGNGREILAKTNFSYCPLNKNPGPGHYEQNSKKNQSNGIAFGLKTSNISIGFLNEKAISKNPGPGKYKVESKKAKGGKFVTLSIRFKDQKQNKPGPGSYELEKSIQSNSRQLNSSKIKFDKASRVTYFENSIKKSITPGPGKYRIPSDFD